MRRLAALVTIAVFGVLGAGAAFVLRDDDSTERPEVVVKLTSTTTYVETRADGSVWECSAGEDYKICTSDDPG